MTKLRRRLAAAAVFVFLVALAALVPTQGWASVLETVKERGKLRCGVVELFPGFAQRDEAGRWQGFDADLCRAFAAAALGDGDLVEVQPLSSGEARSALSAGQLDVLARDATRAGSVTNEALSFAVLALVDGQSFLVAGEGGPLNGLELDGARVCVLEGSAGEAGLVNYGRSAQVTLEPFVLPSLAEMWRALADERCRAVSAGRVALARLRAASQTDTAEFNILPEILSRDQTGSFVRDGDQIWLHLVRWTVFALIQAEEFGITKANVTEMTATSQDPRIQRFLGVTGSLGASFGVADDWVARIIAAVGNYGEIYDRHLGPDTPLGLERGPNALWNDGGLLHAMPFQ